MGTLLTAFRSMAASLLPCKSNHAMAGIRFRDGAASTSRRRSAAYSAARSLNQKREGCMRLVLFEGPGAGRGIRPGVWTDNGITDVSSITNDLDANTPQQ